MLGGCGAGGQADAELGTARQGTNFALQRSVMADLHVDVPQLLSLHTRVCSQVLSRRGAARVLVFCNKIETCRSVENHLRRADRDGSRFKVLVYHEAIRDELRAGFLNSFLQPIKPKELPVVLVATDRMSRGAHSRVWGACGKAAGA